MKCIAGSLLIRDVVVMIRWISGTTSMFPSGCGITTVAGSLTLLGEMSEPAVQAASRLWTAVAINWTCTLCVHPVPQGLICTTTTISVQDVSRSAPALGDAPNRAISLSRASSSSLCERSSSGSCRFQHFPCSIEQEKPATD